MNKINMLQVIQLLCINILQNGIDSSVEYHGSDQGTMKHTFSHTHKFDGFARDCSYTESRPAPGVTVHLSENGSSDADVFIKSA
jgi:hypothetical protein